MQRQSVGLNTDMSALLTDIETKLNVAFSPSTLVIENESHLHAGHSGAAEHAAEHGDTPSHIHIIIAAAPFEGQSRLARHRAVLDTIAEEVAQLHAIRLTFE